ncbi:MAG: MaoC/PaaZ C-terminal domain-containing protein [Dehalococcoidales bacterium]|nr:MaoC/PaaZ C-terminal domain-containing protein [Dehalococcoidales bacterium]
MNKQLYYEDIVPGSDIPPCIKTPDKMQLVKWAGASGDYNPIHYDKDYAMEHNLPGVIVHGQLAACYLGQMITDWIGEKGQLKKLAVTYRGMNTPGEPITCTGVVVNKQIDKEGNLVSLKIWAENLNGEKTLTGTAVVVLPVRE